MKILGKELQLMGDKLRKYTHQCFTCGDTSSSVKYFIIIGKCNSAIYFCNKCAALYSGELSDVVFKAALDNAGNTSNIFEFARSKDFIESIRKDYENEIASEKKEEVPKSSRSLDEYIDNKYINEIKNFDTDKYNNSDMDRDERFAKFLQENTMYGSTLTKKETNHENVKVPFAVRIYTTSDGKSDIVELRYIGGTSKRINITLFGYDCLKDINAYTLIYDERISEGNLEYYMNFHRFVDNDYVVIDYGEAKTPMATIFAGSHSTDRFRFNMVDDFNNHFVIGLLTKRREESNRPIYFIDRREKAPFDDFLN